MKALVLGGYGTVGAVIVNTLRAAGDVALVAGRDPARADRVVDLHDPDTLGSATRRRRRRGQRLGNRDPDAVAALTEFGSAVVDITATTAYVAALERLDPARPVLVSVGLAPGLTNLLAATLHAKSPSDPIDIAVLLGAGERHGEASTQWAYGLLGHRFRDPGSGEEIRNYTRPRRFHVPGHRSRRLVRANYSDQHVLTRDLGVSVRTYFGLDSRLATAALAALTWLPGGSRAPRGPRLPGSDRWLVLARTDGATRWASGRSESRATAEVAAAAARIASPLPPGVHHLHTVATRADVPLGSAIHLG